MLVTVGKTIFHQASASFHYIPRYTNLHKNLSITRCLISAPGLDCFSRFALSFHILRLLLVRELLLGFQWKRL